jgi:hypothetical protein
MDELPSHIIEQIFTYHNKYGINFVTENVQDFPQICKAFYKIYVELRDRNLLIAKRFDRIKKKRDECFKSYGLGVIFDRMYVVLPYYDCGKLIIFIKAYYPANMQKQIKFQLHSTGNCWKKVKYKAFEYVNTTSTDGDMTENTWITYINGPEYYGDHGDLLYFAIKMYNDNGIDLWDNNDGWNYIVSRKFHYIPYYRVVERDVLFEIFDRNSEPYPLDDEYVSLTAYLWWYINYK